MFEEIESPDTDLTPEEIELRNACRNLTDEEFFAIEPKWCTKPEDLQFPITHPQYSEDIYIECNLEKLIEISDNLFDVRFSRKFNGPWWEDERFCKTLLERWQKGLGVDPPVVSFRNGHSSFADGRHRTVLAKELGATTIIIRINPEFLETAKQLVEAKTLE
jgi:hypothetical protein